MKVVLWLSIIKKVQGLHSSSGELWWREVETDCVPMVGVGDTVHLWADEDDGDLGGLSLEPRRRYMGASGRWHVELARVVVDPPEPIRQQIMAEYARGTGYNFDIWWTSGDGPVPDTEQLNVFGWSAASTWRTNDGP